MARLEARLTTNMLNYAPLLGTFTEQTATRMVLVVPGSPERTMIFTGSFSYEDPNLGSEIGDLPDNFDFGNYSPDDFDSFLPDGFQDFLDQFEGFVPISEDFEKYDVWGTVTGLELLHDGSSVWEATALNIPLGYEEGEQSVIDMLGLFTSGFSDADQILGSEFDDWLLGYSGDDALAGNKGNDRLDGGDGQDTAQYSGNQSSYTLSLSPFAVTLEDRRSDSNGTDTLVGIEFADFDNDLFGSPFNLTQFGGPTGLSPTDFESFIELYIALFNRAPDAVGLNFWGTAFANGTTLREMTSLFFDQDETRALYPETFTNAEFVAKVYQNVLGREYDQDGFEFWVPVLDDDSNGIGRDSFIFEFLAGVQPNTPDETFLQAKVDIGAYFAVHKGMSDVDNASAAMALFDGSQSSIDQAVAAIDNYYEQALDPNDGEFLMQVVGVLDDPFSA